MTTLAADGAAAELTIENCGCKGNNNFRNKKTKGAENVKFGLNGFIDIKTHFRAYAAESA